MAAGIDGCADAATGSPGAFNGLGTANPALREPGSPLVCSGICSLTFKPPVKVDHLVTFNFLPNRYQQPGYQHFRNSSGRLSTRHQGGGGASTHSMLLCGNR
jgi:hypothetical protein